MHELHLFAGIGGGILGGMLLGHTCVCAVEIEPYCRRVLLQRQREGIIPRFPIWDGVQTFNAQPWRGKVDVVCGGFPCQDISVAGKGAGIDGERSGLWREFARVIREIRPHFVFVENSPTLTCRGLGRVLGDLAKMGYNAEWCVLGASDTGARHRRKRIWILGANTVRQQRNSGPWKLLRPEGERSRVQTIDDLWPALKPVYQGWEVEPSVGRMANGVADGMDRLKAIGNGQVPIVAATAFRLLQRRMVVEA